ncbi:hypothetical protein LCGC14_3107620 [marine sediment metagenome]|uniref:CHRD domain-containing protein n=1 Tax=marine sediment metagenome TaxID=412755 RepID=A0A0F8W6C5_9ZZZZ
MKKYHNISEDPLERAKERAKKIAKSKKTQFWTLCICFTILFLLSALGIIGFALVLGVKSDLNGHEYCLDLTGCKEQDQSPAENPPECVGDRDGVGWAKIIVEKNKICIDILIDDISLPIISMHIHGPLTIDAPKIAGIFVPEDGSSSFDVEDNIEIGTGIRIISCESVSKSISDTIIDNPHLFYLNVHNAAFEEGAIRDQLGNGCEN